MDIYEATRIVYSRIQTLDPDHAAKIMGLLLLQDDGEKQMIRLAFGPETLLHSVVASARADLGLLSPCLFFSRGFCKNGDACRFPHSDADTDADPDPFFAGQRSFGSSFAPNSGFLLHHDSQREAMAAAMMLGGEDGGYFGRSRLERFENYGGLVNPVSRQIYLTFPADSTFREEDVSNYFSIYGPVQDVRIPYQQKRMFGFVTFHYPETVKLILAKGNPHFVCDARVLVKPYKEKGKVVDKKMQQQQQHLNGGDRLNDFSRDHYDLQQLGARMSYANNQEALLRRKLEEQQQAAELQQAIELQERRLMSLQLLDLKSRSFSSLSSPSPIHTPTSIIPTTRDEAPLPNSFEGKCQSAVNFGDISGVGGVEKSDKIDKEEPAVGEGNRNFESDFHKSVEHNLPHSPFASPTKSSFVGTSFSMASDAVELASANDSNYLRAPSLLPTTPSLDMASIKSCLFQMPRFSSPGHGAIGM